MQWRSMGATVFLEMWGKTKKTKENDYHLCLRSKKQDIYVTWDHTP